MFYLSTPSAFATVLTETDGSRRGRRDAYDFWVSCLDGRGATTCWVFVCSFGGATQRIRTIDYYARLHILWSSRYAPTLNDAFLVEEQCTEITCVFSAGFYSRKSFAEVRVAVFWSGVFYVQCGQIHLQSRPHSTEH